MTKDEVLKLALDALEANQPINYCMNNNGEKFPMMQEDPFRFERNIKAITAIKEALAQPAQQQDPPDGCVVVARAILRKLGIADDVIDTIARPTAQQQEPTVPNNSQEWAGMDGTTAYWLIQRHADGWADVGKMMGEWLEANKAQPEQEHVATSDTSEKRVDEMAKQRHEPEPVIDKSAATRIATSLGWTPQRTWVGLTDEEIIDVIHPLVMADMADEATDYEIARAIEAKLKEKNT